MPFSSMISESAKRIASSSSTTSTFAIESLFQLRVKLSREWLRLV